MNVTLNNSIINLLPTRMLWQVIFKSVVFALGLPQAQDSFICREQNIITGSSESLEYEKNLVLKYKRCFLFTRYFILSIFPLTEKEKSQLHDELAENPLASK